jgi:hypothetical protein
MVPVARTCVVGVWSHLFDDAIMQAVPIAKQRCLRLIRSPSSQLSRCDTDKVALQTVLFGFLVGGTARTRNELSELYEFLKRNHTACVKSSATDMDLNVRNYMSRFLS